MKLSDKNREILIEYISQSLESISKRNVAELFSEKARFKTLGSEEETAMEQILKNPIGFGSLLEKVLWHTSHDVLFDLFCVIDGVADPGNKDWKGVLLIDLLDNFEGHVEFLHDDV